MPWGHSNSDNNEQVVISVKREMSSYFVLRVCDEMYNKADRLLIHLQAYSF